MAINLKKENMQLINKFLYNIHPFTYLALLMMITVGVMKYYQCHTMDIILTLLGEIIYLAGIAFIIMHLIEGQYSSERKYVGTILMQKNDAFEPVYISYFKEHKTAKLALQTQIWVMRHFREVKKSDLVVSVISK